MTAEKTPQKREKAALKSGEKKRLQELEGVIDKGLKTFVEVGNALREIRDKELYREEFDRFEDYCRERWQMSRPRAYQQMDAAHVSTVVDISNEAQARELVPVVRENPEAAQRLWEDLREAQGGPPTAWRIREAVAQWMMGGLPPDEQTRRMWQTFHRSMAVLNQSKLLSQTVDFAGGWDSEQRDETARECEEAAERLTRIAGRLRSQQAAKKK